MSTFKKISVVLSIIASVVMAIMIYITALVAFGEIGPTGQSSAEVFNRFMFNHPIFIFATLFFIFLPGFLPKKKHQEE